MISSQNLQLENYFNGMISVKNHDLRYCQFNARGLQLTGFRHFSQLEGLTDFELRCRAAESADSFQNQDKEVLQTGLPLLTLDIHTYADEQLHCFLTEKSPLKNEQGKVQGVVAVSTEFSSTPLAAATINLLGKEVFSANGYQGRKLVNSYLPSLTDKESEVIFYLLKGKTAKEIALLLHRSKRTIEHHLERLKDKLNCSNKAELISRCMELGFLNVLPKDLIGSLSLLLS